MSGKNGAKRGLGLLITPWQRPFSALAILIIVGTIGYRLTEGWDWGDCIWMVLITVSTIGYGEVETLSPQGRLVTVLIVVGGLVVVQLAIQRVLGLKESGYFHRLQKLHLHRMLELMHNHVILCGYGRIGQEIAAQLLRYNVPFVVIETDSNRRDVAESKGFKVLQADATLDETLLEAGLKRCKSLIAALPGDASNLYIVLSARDLCPDCRLVARASSDEATAKLRLAGASAVVNHHVAGGRVMATSALRPLALDFMELLVGSDHEIEEFQLNHKPQHLCKIYGRSLAELELGRRSGAMVLAILDQGRLIANPGSHIRLGPGQLLIVLGSQPQLSRFQDLLGEAVDSVTTTVPS
ncbi:NAD-binding protein [Synechococcus sp. M16CYN]|uniref:potassium channel family protein n=1 Tax=Synechococcus sp. M16CYN TaxID=3103139 RepID=UPI003244CED6